MLSTMSQSTKLLLLNVSFVFLLCFYLSTHLSPSPHQFTTLTATTTPYNNSDGQSDNESCANIRKQHGYEAKCWYARSNKGCQSQGYIQYLQLFYCSWGQQPALGYALFLVWLVLLFYISGNTAADYFCSSLEGLSKVLKLSPTIAGVTLLSLGNGASDVFTTIVSFIGSGVGQVGLNSVLGGAFFISSVVVGIITISIGSKSVFIDTYSFTRDVLFLIVSLTSLLLILSDGKIDIWNATAFVFLYVLYMFTVSTTHLCSEPDPNKKGPTSDLSPTRSFYAFGAEELGKLDTPLLSYVGDQKLVSTERIFLEDGDDQEATRCSSILDSRFNRYFLWVLYILQLPLYLPRRLTIPVVSEKRWSKPFAVTSVTLAPVLLAAVSNCSKARIMVYIIGAFIGVILGILAFATTKKSSPPNRCVTLWLLGGFFMSVTWTYIVAKEMVAFLVSLGKIFGISPSLLALTVLAWGNSLGDLMADVTLAMKAGEDGAQVAISGCYAGPLFNILIGLGLSFVFAALAEYPSSYIVPKDPSLNLTIGFFICGLLWALVILPRQNMKLGKFLGAGLLSIYLCFMSVRLVQTLGLL